MVSVPDRTGPNYAELADSSERSTEGVDYRWPFQIAHDNGYIESMTIASGESFEIKFVADRDYTDENSGENGWSHFFVWCAALSGYPLLVGPTEMEYWGSGTGSDASDTAGTGRSLYNQGKTYRMRLTYTDVDTLTVTTWEENAGGAGLSSTLVVTNLFNDGNPVFYIGALPDAHRALTTVAADGVYATPCDGLVILEAPDNGNLGPTDITIDNATIAAGDTGVDVYIGQFSTVHASETKNFLYTLVAGTGDTDNASYTLSEDGKLYTAAVLTAGGDSIRVQTKDKYGLTYEEAVTITIS